VIDERIALPKERAPEQYVAWGPNSLLKLLDEGMAGVHAENIAHQLRARARLSHSSSGALTRFAD